MDILLWNLWRLSSLISLKRVGDFINLFLHVCSIYSSDQHCIRRHNLHFPKTCDSLSLYFHEAVWDLPKQFGLQIVTWRTTYGLFIKCFLFCRSSAPTQFKCLILILILREMQKTNQKPVKECVPQGRPADTLGWGG